MPQTDKTPAAKSLYRSFFGIAFYRSNLSTAEGSWAVGSAGCKGDFPEGDGCSLWPGGEV